MEILAYAYCMLLFRLKNELQLEWREPEESKESETACQRPSAGRGFSPYTSCLFHLHAYRLNPLYRYLRRPVSSTSHANLVDPRRQLCRFDLVGTCNDDRCTWQHGSHYRANDADVVADLCTYCPALTGGKKEETDLYKFAKQFLSDRSGHNLEQVCLELVGLVQQRLKSVAPHYLLLEKRIGRLRHKKGNEEDVCRKVGKRVTENIQWAVLRSSEDTDPDATVNESDVRYFAGVPSRSESLEAAVAKSPGDVQLWLKLAHTHFHSGHSEKRLERALDVLSRALEENREDPDLWLNYLDLYGNHPTGKEMLPSVCQQAVQFCPTFQLWWKYLQVAEGYDAKMAVCRSLLVFLLQSDQAIHLLEVFLYAIHLTSQSGRFQMAVHFLQRALDIADNEEDDSTRLLEGKESEATLRRVLGEMPLLWLSYVHLVAFGFLPTCLFQQQNVPPSTDTFLIRWPTLAHLRTPPKVLQEILVKARERCKRSLPLYYNLAELELVLNGLDAAAAPCLQLLEDEPDHVEMWIYLSSLFQRVGHNRRVGELYERAISSLGHVPRLCNARARFLLGAGDVAEAVRCLEECFRASDRSEIADDRERAYLCANRA